MIILGIETSCDETAAAVVEGKNGKVEVLSNVVASQINIHKKYGGVVPEVAAREHVLNILPVVNETLEKARISLLLQKPDLKEKWRHSGNSKSATGLPRSASATGLARHDNNFFDAIAVTVGPGLITSLIVGVETAKTLAYVWDLPIMAVNHIEGHIYANFIDHRSWILDRGSRLFPALILTVSGGDTVLVRGR